MYGFCGWLAGGSRDSETATDAIRKTLNCQGDLETHELADASGRIILCRGLYSQDICIRDGSTAVMLGRPDWSEDELASLAREQGPAAALIAGYQKLGREVLKQLHGPFALAVKVKQKALLAVDRIGIHTLSYGFRDGVFAFGSSARSVAAHPAFGLDPDPQALYHFFYFAEIPSPGTLYQNVEKLLPAQCVELVDGKLQRDFYWQMRYTDSGAPKVEPLARRFRELLEQAVGKCYTEPPAAAFLSGGTDSSAVTGMLTRVTAEPVHTYSMGFAVKGFDEMAYARATVRHFGTVPHEFYVSPEDVLQGLTTIAQVYDEPFGNESAVSAYLCASRAREEGVRVLLAGDGGDEIFGGNTRYSKQMIFERYFQIPKLISEGLLEPLIFNFPFGDAVWPVRKARSYIEQARIRLPERFETYNHLHRTPLESIFEPAFLSGIRRDQPVEMLRDAYFRAQSDHPINRMLHLDLKFTLADNDLRKVSRMCEAAGVEVRYPLLDESLVEFSGELPPDYKVRGRQLRWLFKEALKDFLPQETLRKQKHGFGLPFGEWALSHPALQAEVESLIHAFSSRGVFQPSYLREIKRLHTEEHATFYGSMLWRVAMLEAWLQAHDY